MVRFDYSYLPVSDMTVRTETHEKTGRRIPVGVIINDEEHRPTDRFWVSLFARYGFNKSIFNYFDYAEVFDRISEREANDQMRVCVERNSETGTNSLMAVSNPTKPVVVYDDLIEMLERYNGDSISYDNGIVESSHKPRHGSNKFTVCGDAFENRFVLSTPIDGYGAPNIYLSLLREICENGMIGYAKEFRSSLALGKAADDVSESLTRALDGFNSDEGYACIRNRMESAAKSWASVYEAQSLLYKTLVRLHSQKAFTGDKKVVPGTNIHKLLTSSENSFLEAEGGASSPILNAFHRMTGDASELYGLANLDALSAKRQRTLPVKCKVYDLINFATEVATHHATPAGARSLNALVGTMISDEYDMEGTCDKYSDFADFHMSSKLAGGVTGSN